MGYNTTADGTQIFALRDLKLGQAKFIEINFGYEEMAIDGQSGASGEIIWNGTGGGDTGGDWTPSGTGSETSGAMHSGTNGWDTGVTTKDATTVFDNGSMIDIINNYQSLEFWMSPQAFPSGSFLSLQWLDSADGAIGSRLDVNDYVTNFDLDVWQKVTIPLVDFNLSGNIQKLRIQYRKVAGQHFYFDDIGLFNDVADGPFMFRVAADGYYNYHIGAIYLYIASGDTGWNSDAFANIAGGLDSGVLLRHYNIEMSSTIWSINFKNNIDLYGRMVSHNNVDFFDSEHIATFVLRPEPASVIVTENEVLDIVIRDDLSSINSLRAFVHYGAEEI